MNCIKVARLPDLKYKLEGVLLGRTGLEKCYRPSWMNWTWKYKLPTFLDELNLKNIARLFGQTRLENVTGLLRRTELRIVARLLGQTRLKNLPAFLDELDLNFLDEPDLRMLPAFLDEPDLEMLPAFWMN
ncbi:hypothetical protein RclHR1_07550016 [Rhizophagus clarus]|uniref:Uncharacterized protein n=1 Tax=Rhizophagus clarus TaxID=94130 RepID=A0A2Z6RX87_9GLOM|nr:hypothetical protein RclHR1_07550016 [Rhizophagus clarus]